VAGSEAGAELVRREVATLPVAVIPQLGAGVPHDLEELVRFIARRIVGQEEADAVTSEVLHWIQSHLGLDYGWPGNIRELRNLIERLLILHEGHEVRATDLPGEFGRGSVGAVTQ